MGAVHFSIDGRLLARLRELLPLEVFVETGTYEGASVDAALAYFDELHTIELSDELFARAAARFEDSPAVHVHNGSSAEVLSRLSGRLRRRSVLYWLDAHFCGHRSVGGELQCPLMGELEAIGSLGVRSVILIDDARLFMTPPPAPLIAEQWPSFSEVLARLSTLNPGHELIVIDDVIVFFPPEVGEALRRFAREHAVDWLFALAWGRELDHTVERIATHLERLDEIAGQGTKAMQSLDARLDSVHGQVEAVQNQMADLNAKLRAVHASLREPSPAQPPADVELLEALQRIMEHLRVTRGQLTELSKSQREAHHLIEAQAQAVAEARTRADSLLRAAGGPRDGDRTVRAEVAD
jgi:prefoldin subunit 5